MFESLGLGSAFDGMLVGLRAELDVVLIRVAADPDRCLRRVRTRDASKHLEVSDERVASINAAVVGRSHPFAGVLENDHASPDDLLRGFERIRAGRAPGGRGRTGGVG